MSDEAWLPFVASYVPSCIQKQAHHTHQFMANFQMNLALPVVSSPLELLPPVAAKENFWEYKWCRFIDFLKEGDAKLSLSLTPVPSTKVNTSKGTIILINLSNNAEAINKF